ncbi:TatD related DNase [Novymonas esmeraldas]|uniref:TatD related DNase n=1 Tax=Novymonas esmeraldas TaxID=1808958 RepID=A0AAW0F1S2_9TRYP
MIGALSTSAVAAEARGSMRGWTGCRLAYARLCDSHCHLRCGPASMQAVSADPGASAGPTTQSDSARCTVASVMLCGTHPSIDWDAVELASAAPAEALVGFGVHPWFVPDATPHAMDGGNAPTVPATTDSPRGDALDRGCCCVDGATALAATPTLTLVDILRGLEERLQRHPRALVAEIGLDKLRGPPEAVQVDAFTAQLRLAATYHRPVSVHCVRHYGLLLKVLQDLPAEHTPPAIIVHAFTGSLEVAKSLLSLKNKKRAPATRVVETTPGDAAAEATATASTRKTTKRGGSAADAVRIKDRIFFGVGVSTSFTVKNFAAVTLPYLLDARRVLVETDAHYTGVEAPPGAGAGVTVDPREHVESLAGAAELMCAALAQNSEFVAKAEASGTPVEVLLQDALCDSHAQAFRSVSVSPTALDEVKVETHA